MGDVVEPSFDELKQFIDDNRPDETDMAEPFKLNRKLVRAIRSGKSTVWGNPVDKPKRSRRQRKKPGRK